MLKKIGHRFAATGIAFLLLINDYPARADARDGKTQDVYGNTVTTPAPPSDAALKTGERGPLIEVSVDSLEISESDTNILGILWGQQGANTNGITALDPNHINFLEQGTPAIFNANTFNRVGLMAQLQALITNSQIRILANPTLITKSGYEASFLVGGEIPYPTPAPVGQAPGVEFKKYGVALKILPQFTPRNTIEAQINVGVSSPDNSVAIQISGTSVPGIASREAGSKVEVADGETVVLAGIKQSRRSKIITRIPILSSIPLIGLLFRHHDEEVTQTSLVLFVTFRIVKAASNASPAPTAVGASAQ